MSEPSQTNSKPLSGIRIVDFTRFFAGPYCAQLLGDLGADVIKVELPVTGDPLRQQGPPFFAGNGITYYATNRNKRSITLDMQAPEGRRLARELCLKADVVLENFRPDVMKKLGLDYEGLSSEAPRLIYASISGFGPDGPDASQGAFDLTIQALGGYMSITGERDGAPIKLGTSAFDMLAGMNCQSAIMTALFQRASTGRGQKVTTSLLESEVAFLANAALEYLITGVEPQKWGSEHAQQVPYKAFRTSDGWAIIGAGFQNFFEAFVKIVGRPELAQDERFKSMSGRVSHREALYGILRCRGAEVRHRRDHRSPGGSPRAMRPRQQHGAGVRPPAGPASRPSHGPRASRLRWRADPGPRRPLFRLQRHRRLDRPSVAGPAFRRNPAGLAGHAAGRHRAPARDADHLNRPSRGELPMDLEYFQSETGRIEDVVIGTTVIFTKTVSESDVYLYAGITGDFSPNHIDEEYMKQGGYGGRIAHGTLLMGFMSTASAKMRVGRTVSLGYDKVRFLGAARFGDTITTRYTIIGVDLDKRRIMADVKCTNQRGELIAVATNIKAFVDTAQQ